jgi:hypothetical protein
MRCATACYHASTWRRSFREVCSGQHKSSVFDATGPYSRLFEEKQSIARVASA